MTIVVKLADPVELAAGTSIQPPAGWTQEGFLSEDNPLWLKPKSRFAWRPPGVETAVLHWHLSEVSLLNEVMSQFIQLLSGESGWIAVEKLESLHPALIRMPLVSVTRARVSSGWESDLRLGVEYFFPETTEFGIVYYSPTEKSDEGEFEILGYEGREPEYSRYWQIARASMDTFASGSHELGKLLDLKE